jgi:hypothetical protein
MKTESTTNTANTSTTATEMFSSTWVNLTPHPINVVGAVVANFPPSGQVARVSVVNTPLMLSGLISAPTFGEVVGLPPEQPCVWLIVSGMVRAALPLREDLLSPADPVRDADGKIIGCGGFHANPRL